MSDMSKDEAIKARGERITKLRKETRLSRVDFCKKYHFPETTMKAWEYGISGSITADSLSQLIKAFKNENVFCTADYLLDGNADLDKINLTKSNLQQTQNVHDRIEIETFYHLYKGAFHAFASDNLMTPALKKGDLVLGIQRNLEDIKNIFNSICIIKMIDESVHIRTLLPCNKRDFFILNTLREDEQGLILANKQEITMIAPVIKTVRLFN